MHANNTPIALSYKSLALEKIEFLATDPLAP